MSESLPEAHIPEALEAAQRDSEGARFHLRATEERLDAIQAILDAREADDG